MNHEIFEEDITGIYFFLPTDGPLIISAFSVIAQVINAHALIGRELRHTARGDYNTEAIIFKMAAARFLDVSKEETSKMKENAGAVIIT